MLVPMYVGNYVGTYLIIRVNLYIIPLVYLTPIQGDVC
jgi:hypothetical protein